MQATKKTKNFQAGGANVSKEVEVRASGGFSPPTAWVPALFWLGIEGLRHGSRQSSRGRARLEFISA